MKVDHYKILCNVPESGFEPFDLDGYYFDELGASIVHEPMTGIFSYYPGKVFEITKDHPKAWSCMRGKESEAFIEFLAEVEALKRLGRGDEMPYDGEHFACEFPSP